MALENVVVGATRLLGAVALAALLLYGGIALGGAAVPLATAAALVAATVLGAVVAVWALAALATSRAAAWTVVVLLGLAPIATFVGWMVGGDAAGILVPVLWVNLLAGVGAGLLAAWLGAQGAPEPAPVPRVG